MSDRAVTFVLAALIAPVVPACASEAADACDGGIAQGEMTIMQYNIAAHDTLDASPWKGALIAAQIAATAPDFVTAQECDPCDSLVAQLPDRYALAAPGRSGVTIVYDSLAWEPTRHAFMTLGEDDDGWGERVLLWTEFAHVATGDCVHIYSTHWCVPIRSDDDACDTDRQLDYARALTEHIADRGPAAASAVGGDLNVFDQFEDGPVIGYLLDGGLVDVFRESQPTDDGATFAGNSWAPAGRIDYVLTSSPVTVIDAYVDRETIASGDGSDHYPVVARVQFGSN